MKKRLSFVLGLLILAVLPGCKSEDMIAPDLLEPVDVKMDVAQAQMGEIYNISIYNGEVVPYVEGLQFLVDGYLEDMKVSLGDTVQEGQVLATLSEEQSLSQIEALEEEIAHIVKLGEFSDRQTNADIGIAKEELAILKESGASAKTCAVKELEIRQLELGLEQTRELRSLELQEKRRSLEALQEKTGKNQITAPFDGTVVWVSETGIGDAVQGYTPVLYIADESRLSLSTDYISESTIADADQVYAKIMDKEYEIAYVPYDKSEYISMALSGEEMKTRFSIEAETGEVESGQFAVVMVLSDYRENVLTIPVNALYRDENGRYVYKVVEDERIRCDVTVGMSTDTKAEIVEGLREGDVVYVKE